MRLMGLVPLCQDDLRDLYRLMRQQNFPDTPETYEEALPFLKEVESFGIFHNRQLIAAFLVGDRGETSAFLDAICAPDWEGRWLKRRFIRQLGNYLFQQCRLNYIWVETRNRTALEVTLKAGFVPITPMDEDPPMLILTRRGFEEKFMNRKNKEKCDGVCL